MSNEKPAQLHALLFQGHAGEGFYIGDRCKSFGCAVNSINPLNDAGSKVIGRVWMEPEPISAPAYRDRHQDAIAAVGSPLPLRNVIAQMRNWADVADEHVQTEALAPAAVRAWAEQLEQHADTFPSSGVAAG